MKHACTRFPLAKITILALASTLAFGCLADGAISEQELARENLALQIAQAEGELCEAFDYAQEEMVTATQGEATKCGKGSTTVTRYAVPSQPIDTGETDIDEAKKKCAKWAMDHSTLVKGWAAPKCPGCPDGSSGCEVENPRTDKADVELQGGTYFCVGDGYVVVRYSCTKCTLDGCSDTTDNSVASAGLRL